MLPEASEPIDQAAQEDEAIPQDELDDKIENEAGIHEYVVSTGDTLSSVLNQYGIDMGNISQLAAADKDKRQFRKQFQQQGQAGHSHRKMVPQVLEASGSI